MGIEIFIEQLLLVIQMHTEDKRATIRQHAPGTMGVFEPRSQHKTSLSSSEELNSPLFHQVTKVLVIKKNWKIEGTNQDTVQNVYL